MTIKRLLFGALLALFAVLGTADARLGVSQLQGFNAGGGAVAITFTESATSTSNLTTYTFSSLNLGTASSGRQIVVAAFGTSSQTISTLTVGGISASLIVGRTDTSSERRVELWAAPVPTGTSGDVVVTWSGAQIRSGVGVFSMTGALSTANDTQSDAVASGASSVSLNIPSNGGAIAVGDSATSGLNSWTGLTERYDENVEAADYHSGASDIFQNANAALTVTFTPSVSGINVMAAASWAPQ